MDSHRAAECSGAVYFLEEFHDSFWQELQLGAFVYLHIFTSEKQEADPGTLRDV